MSAPGRTHHPARYVHRRVAARPFARIAAASALLLGVAGWALVVWGALDHPLITLAGVVLAPLFLGAVFLALTSVGFRRLVGMVGSVVLAAVLVGGLVLLNLSRDGWRFEAAFGLLLLGVSAGLARVALTIPPPPPVDVAAVPVHQRTTRRAALIVNLRSGDGKAEQFDLLDRCAELGVRTVVLSEGDDLPSLARRVAAEGIDALGMAGGDGSLGCVAEVAMECDVPFVCVPVGTRNHFALDLGLDRNDPTQALGAFVSGEERRLDVATVNDTVFLNNVSLGVYAAIVEQEGYRDAKLQTALELLPALYSEGGPWFDLEFDVPDHGRLERAALVQVSNNPYVLTGEIGRRSRLDSGELGIVTVDPQRLGDLVGLTVLAAARLADRSSALWSWSAPELVVESPHAELAAGVDGETVTLSTPLRFAVRPRALRVLVPQGTRVGLKEQHLGADGTYSGLLSVALGLGGSSDE